MRFAAFDLGSNSIKVTIAERAEDGSLEVLEQHAKITRIGEGLDRHGALQPAAIERTLAGLSQLVERARALGVTHMKCVATAGMRGAGNAPAFVSRVQSEIGLDIEIIDGLREAELAFRAPSARFGPEPILVVDVGGRSTELICGQNAAIAERVSFEIGSVRLTERFIAHDPPKPDEVEQLRQEVKDTLTSAPALLPDGVIVGVSGTVLSLLGLQEGLDAMSTVVLRHDGAWLRRSSVKDALEDLATKTTEQRLRGTVIPPGRADVIVAGAAVVLEILERYGVDRMRVTDQGVRFGMLFEMLEPGP